MRIRQHFRFIGLMLGLGLLVWPSHALFTPKVMAAPSLETSTTFRLFHPVFVKDSDLVSTLHLYNGNNTELPMTLTFLNQWGAPVLTTNHILGAHSHFSLSSRELLNLSTGSYAVMAASSAPFSSIVRYLNPDRGQLSLYRGLQETTAALTLHFGPFFATEVQTSALLLASIGTATTILTATFYDMNGDLVATYSEVIAPGGSLTIDTNQLTLPVGFVGRVKVTSSFGQPLLGLLRTTSPAGKLTYQPPIAIGASVQQSTAEVAYQHFYPRVLRNYDESGGPQTTTLFLSNLATVASATTTNYVNSNGMFELPTMQSLPAGGGALIPMTNRALPNGIWSAIISSSQSIATAELTEYEGPSDFASAAYGSDMDTEIALPYIARATTAHTIFSVQNVGTVDAVVQISYYGQAATPPLYQAVTIRPGATARLDPRTIGQLPLTFEGSVVMTSTQPLVAWVDEYVRVKQAVPIQAVTLTGPTTGLINQTYNFTAAIAPVTATVPITYTWYPNDPSLSQSFSQTGGITNVATLNWSSTGSKSVRVVAANTQGVVTSVVHQINMTISPTPTPTPIVPTPTSTPSASPAFLSGFKVNEHGYRFANPVVGAPLLTATDVYKIFGDSGCKYELGPACVIRMDALQWVLTANQLLGGQCNGMSVTSLRFFQGVDQVKDFQPFSTIVHDLLLQNPLVLRHLASYHVRWSIPEVQRRMASYFQQSQSLKQAITLIKHGFENGAPLVLYISKEDSAHAVVPYAVHDMGNDTIHIYIYDSNHPDDLSRIVVVHPNANTWTYEFAPGDTWSNLLLVYPASAYQGPFDWGSWGSDQQVTSSSVASSTVTTMLVSPGLELTSPTGQSLTQYFIPTGTADPAPVVYIMPITDTYQLRVDRSEVVSGTGSILYAGQGYVANIDGLNVSEKVDLLTVNNSTAKVGYLSRSPSSLMFTLSATESEVDALVTLKNVEISPNSAMTITADNDNVSVMLNSTSATKYDLDMVINSAVITSQRFINSDIHITGGDRQIINIPAQSNASVILNTDVGNTGAQITSTILPNEAVQTDKLYLPLINR